MNDHPNKQRGLYTPQVNPYGIHMESMDSTPPFHGFHMEWFWVRSQLFSGSMVTLDSIWNGHKMAME